MPRLISDRLYDFLKGFGHPFKLRIQIFAIVD